MSNPDEQISPELDALRWIEGHQCLVRSDGRGGIHVDCMRNASEQACVYDTSIVRAVLKLKLMFYRDTETAP